MQREHRVIVNPSAGGGRALARLPDFERELAAHGLSFSVEHTRDLAHARELARGAALAGQTVLSLGGDGLLGAVAEGLRGLDGVVGLLPGGRGNDLARVLRIPAEPMAACAVIAADHRQPLDAGIVHAGGTERLFVGIASAGFDSEANRIANLAPPWLGQLVYAYGAMGALSRWRPARFTLRLTDAAGAVSTRRFSGFTVAAANSRAYGGGMFLAPDAALDDGLLDVVVIEALPRLRFLATLPKVFRGRHIDEQEVHVLRASRLELDADRPFTLYADGDPMAELPVDIRCLPAALQVIVPLDGGPRRPAEARA